MAFGVERRAVDLFPEGDFLGTDPWDLGVLVSDGQGISASSGFVVVATIVGVRQTDFEARGSVCKWVRFSSTHVYRSRAS